MCIIGIFLISSASASDLNETTVSQIDDEMMSVEDAQGEMGVSVNDESEILTANHTPQNFNEIQTTVESAGDNDTIILDGYYLFENTIDIDKPLNFVGKNDATVDGNNAVRLFSLTANGVTFKNITFKNANSDDAGGAIYSTSSFIVVNCSFACNHATSGGAIYCNQGKGGDCTVVDCTFISNSAQYSAGAIMYGSAVNCSFVNNSASSGGALEDGSAVNCSFVNNSASSSGGAMYGGSAVNCTFLNNSASSGGAIWYASAFNCTFINNGADANGGAMGYASAENCKFTNNTAKQDGGAGYCSNAVNCSFIGNSAVGNAGAMIGSEYNSYSATECIFINNTAGKNGGALVSIISSYSLFENNFAYGDGGAINNGKAFKCTFNDNSANGYGGAVCNANVSLDSTFDNNRAAIGNDTFNVTFFQAGLNFKQLDELINSGESEIYLTSNYSYFTDQRFKDGIKITQSITVHGNGAVIDADLRARIFYVSNAEVILKDIVFKNGKATNGGGAVYGNCTLINCTFINNDVNAFEAKGGAVYGNCIAVDCTFIENCASGYSGQGGAMHGGRAENCSFIANYVGGTSDSYGGALYDCNAVNCTFINNSASRGGAMFAGSAFNCNFINNSADLSHITYGSTPSGGAMCGTLAVNCTFISNSATGNYCKGGAAYDGSCVNCTFINNYVNGTYEGYGGALYDGSAENCTFTRCYASNDGGAMYGGIATNCIFNDNHASGNGGAMYGGQIIDSIFTNNSATNGGSIYMSACSGSEIHNSFATENGGGAYECRLTDCTFTGNSAIDGGAIYNTQAFNSLFEDNHARNGGAMFGGIASNCTFNNNKANGYGGAVCNANVSMDSTFKNNAAYVGDDTYNVTFFLSGKNFKELDWLINNNNTSEIYLNQNFTYEGFDYSFVDGITINRALTIYGNGFTIDGGDYVRIFKILNSNVVLRDIIFVNARSLENGAIYGNCTIINCTFVDNHAEKGGAIYGNCTIINCTFVDNVAEKSGGVIYGDCTLINSSFINNYCDGYRCGAIYGDCNVTNCTFIGNHARGSVIYGNSKVIDSTFSNNDGGVMHGGSAINCVFNDNSGSSWGVMYSVSAVNCTFINNFCEDYGGAIYGGSAVNSTFIGNRARDGAAVYKATVINCTFIDNYGYGAFSRGGAMYLGYALNCTFIGNSAYAGGAIFEGACENCTFINNSAWSTSGWTSAYENSGGAIYNSNASNCIFIGNYANMPGGAMYYGSAVNCTFVNNSANGDSAVDAFLNDCKFDVVPQSNVFHYTSILDINDLIILGKDNFLTAHLYNVQGPVVNRTVIFTINGQNYNVTTDDDGLANLNIGNILNELGSVNVFVSFDGDEVNSAVSLSAIVSVKSNPTLNVNNLSVFIGDNGFLVANLSDINGPLFGKLITISANGKEYNLTTDFDGLARFNVKNLLNESGRYDVDVIFAGDEFIAPISSISHVVVKKYDSVLEINDLNIRVGENGTLIAVLYDSRGQLSGKNISFTIDGSTYFVASDEDGLAKLNIADIDKIGEFDVVASFAGDAYNNPVSADSHLIIKKWDALLDVNDVFIVLGDECILIADLSNDNGPLVGKDITFTINANSYTYATDSKGMVRFERNIFTEYGTFNVGVSFEGDAYNNPASANANVCINKNIYNLTVMQVGDYYGNTNLSFKLVDFKTNSSISGAQITLSFSNGINVTDLVTDSNGVVSYDVPFAPGNYSVDLTVNMPYVGINAVGLNTFEISKVIGMINIVQDKDCRILNIRLYNSLTGEEFKNFNITLAFEPIGEEINVTTDDEGMASYNMTFDAGTYSVVASVFGEYLEFTSVRVDDIVINEKSNSEIFAPDSYEFNFLEVGTIGVNIIGGSINEGNISIVGHSEAIINLNAGNIITISNLTAGNYTLRIKSTPSSKYNSVTRNIPIVVNRIDSILSVSDMMFDYGKTGYAAVNVSGATVNLENIYVVGHDEAIINFNDGIISLSNLSAGSYALSITTTPDENHNSVTSIVEIVVNKADGIIEVDDMTFDYGDSGSTNFTIVGGDIASISIAGHPEIKPKVSNNRITVSGLDAGNYTLNIESSPDENHNFVSRNVSVTVNEKESSIEFYKVVQPYYGGFGYIFVNVEGCQILKENITVVGHSEAIIDFEEDTITVSNLPVGSYVLNVISTPHKNYKSVNKSTEVIVNKIDSNVFFSQDKIVFDYLKSNSTRITVDGGIVSRENIKFVGHPEAIIEFEGDLITVSNLTAGEYTLYVTTTPDRNHNSITCPISVVVNRIDLEVNFTNDIVFDEGGSGSTNITVTGGSWSDVSVINHTEAVINVTGNTILVSNLTVGNYTLHVTTVPDGNHNAVAGLVAIVVNKIPAIIEFTNEVVFDFNGMGNTTVNVIGGDVSPSDIVVVGHSEAEITINNKNMIFVSNLTAGNYTLQVKVTPDANHRSIVGNVSITVNKIESKIICDDVVFDFDEFGFTNVAVEGGILNTSDVYIVNHADSDLRVSADSVNFIGFNAGNYVLHLSSIPDKNHLANECLVNVIVNKVNSSITANGNIVFDYLSSGLAFVMANGGEIDPNNLTIEGCPNAKIDFNNNIIYVSNLNAGVYNLTVRTIPDENHNSISTNITVIVNKIASSIKFINAIAFEYLQSGSATVDIVGGSIGSASVVGHSEIKPVVSGNKITVSGLGVGSYKLHVTVSPDGNHEFNESYTTITVKKITATIKASSWSDYSKSTKKWTVKLVNSNTKKPLANMQVVLKVYKGNKLEKTLKYKTNSKGEISLKPSSWSVGKRTVKISFTKTGYDCKSVSKTVNILKQTKVKYTVKSVVGPDGTSVSIWIKIGKKPIKKGVKFNIYVPKRKKPITVVTGTFKKGNEVNKGFVGYGTNLLSAGTHKITIKPVGFKYTGSKTIKIKIKKGANKYKKSETIISKGKKQTIYNG